MGTLTQESRDALAKELNEKLPPDDISVEVDRGLAIYYDYHGVTFRDSDEEQQVADDYIVAVITEKAGFPVKVTEWSDSNNGHFCHRFERA